MSIDNRMDKFWYIHKMVLFSNKNDQIATIWTILTNIMLNKRSQTQLSMFTFVQRSSKTSKTDLRCRGQESSDDGAG